MNELCYVNPRTNRVVRIGTKHWFKLVKEGVFPFKPIKRVLGKVGEVNIEELNQQLLDKRCFAARGRGKYDGLMVERRLPTKRQKISPLPISAINADAPTLLSSEEEHEPTLIDKETLPSSSDEDIPIATDTTTEVDVEQISSDTISDSCSQSEDPLLRDIDEMVVLYGQRVSNCYE